MSNVKIEKYDFYPFSTDLAVRVSDLNYGAHLGYDRVLSLAHQARLVLFEQLQVTELNLGDEKTGIVVTEVVVKYMGEGFLNDVLTFEIKPVQVGPISFRFSHRVTNKNTGRELALMEIGFVAFDYEKRSLGRIPASFVQKLDALGA